MKKLHNEKGLPQKFLKIIVAMVLIIAISVGLTAINHPIVLTWLSGSARFIGKPINAAVYTDGVINPGIKAYHVDRYWGTTRKANNYIVSLREFDRLGMLKFFNINLDEKQTGGHFSDRSQIL